MRAQIRLPLGGTIDATMHVAQLGGEVVITLNRADGGAAMTVDVKIPVEDAEKLAADLDRTVTLLKG